MSPKQEISSFRATQVLCGAICILLPVGSTWVFGNQLPYLASYMAQYNAHSEMTQIEKENLYQSFVDYCNYIFVASSSFLLSSCRRVFVGISVRCVAADCEAG